MVSKLIKRRRRSTRLDKAAAGTAMLKNVLNRTVERLKVAQIALSVLAEGASWVVDMDEHNNECYEWVGEGNPQVIAQKGLESPKNKKMELPESGPPLKEDKPAPNEGRGASKEKVG